jgi:secreted trypsin-like serine protease
MKLIIVALFGVFSNFALADEGSKFIVGGSDATIEEYPYMAGILNFGWSSCGGTIINQRSILTVSIRWLRNIFVASRKYRPIGRTLHSQ